MYIYTYTYTYIHTYIHTYTKLCRKESDRQAYLHRKSTHPSLKRRIPFAQVFQDGCEKSRNKLIERGPK